MASARSEREKLIPGIVFVDALGGRRAHVAGTGLDVVEVIQAYHAFGDDRDVLVDEFDWLTPEQIDSALAYYRENVAEIDGWLAISDALVPESARH